MGQARRGLADQGIDEDPFGLCCFGAVAVAGEW